MKYQATSRILSVIFHGLIFCAFGALTIYFTFFVLPYHFSANTGRWTRDLFQAPYFLYFELAVLGLVLSICSAIGFKHAIQGVINPRDDQPVIKSLTWFIVEGWFTSLFWLLQATLLFDLLNASSGNLTFVIIMSVVVTIVLLIATNIPMVKLYDNKKQDYLLQSLTLGGVITVWTVALCSLLTLIGSWNGTGTQTNVYANILFSYLGGAMLIIGVILLLAYFALKKGKKASGYLVSTAVLLTGAQLIGYCVIDIVQGPDNNSCHYNGLNNAWQGYGFDIMGFVLGSVIVFASLYLFYALGQDHSKEKINKA